MSLGYCLKYSQSFMFPRMRLLLQPELQNIIRPTLRTAATQTIPSFKRAPRRPNRHRYRIDTYSKPRIFSTLINIFFTGMKNIDPLGQQRLLKLNCKISSLKEEDLKTR